MLTTAPGERPDEPEEVTIGFVNGTPTSVNGAEADPVDLVVALNTIGGRHGSDASISSRIDLSDEVARRL